MLRRTPSALARPAVLLVAGVLLTACAQAPLKPRTGADRPDPPGLGACYELTPDDVAQPSSDKEAVPCSSAHTAQTFAIGTLPKSTGEDYRSSAQGRWIYPRCETAFERFLSVDESLAMRIRLSWAWFRPSERGWADGARWYRCDVVGGAGDSSSSTYRPLPDTVRGLFRARPPEQWLTCARGNTVAGATRVPCSDAHDWRAVTTIKLGEPKDPWPGERLVQIRSRDYCSDSVGAWMNYPVDYEYGYTAFHEAEWKAGNRRTICWARTDR